MASTQTVAARPRTGQGVLLVAYGLLGYAAFAAIFLYAVAFLADVVVPRTVDRGGPASAPGAAVAVDVALLGIFALQHSVMARPAFKRRWVSVVPADAERSTYVLASTAVMALLFWQWRPIPMVVWDLPGPGVRAVVWALYLAGWLWALAMTCAIDHLDLVGLRQVARHLRGATDQGPSFALPFVYRLVRHPMMTGFVVAFLAAPTMTAGHLLFAGLGCAYILVGVRLEERDLTRTLPPYAGYAAVTPRFLPRPTRRGRR